MECLNSTFDFFEDHALLTGHYSPNHDQHMVALSSQAIPQAFEDYDGLQSTTMVLTTNYQCCGDRPPVESTSQLKRRSSYTDYDNESPRDRLPAKVSRLSHSNDYGYHQNSIAGGSLDDSTGQTFFLLRSAADDYSQQQQQQQQQQVAPEFYASHEYLEPSPLRSSNNDTAAIGQVIVPIHQRYTHFNNEDSRHEERETSSSADGYPAPSPLSASTSSPAKLPPAGAVGKSPSKVATSSKNPADGVRVKHIQGLPLTRTDIQILLRDRKKKDNHNMIERRRRFNINDRILELGGLLPKMDGHTSTNGKLNKGAILRASVDYIRELRAQIAELKVIHERYNQLLDINHQLMKQIEETGIKVPPPEDMASVMENSSLLSLAGIRNASNGLHGGQQKPTVISSWDEQRGTSFQTSRPTLSSVPGQRLMRGHSVQMSGTVVTADYKDASLFGCDYSSMPLMLQDTGGALGVDEFLDGLKAGMLDVNCPQP